MMLDVLESPVGSLSILSSDQGLTSLTFGVREGPRTVMPEVRAQLSEYFDGNLTSFDLPLDIHRSPFAQKVSDQLLLLPYGQTISYAELARRAGSPTAVRAAGTACATNPLPIIIGCHRVVRSDGSLGGYLGGLEVKAWLLDLESGRSSHA